MFARPVVLCLIAASILTALQVRAGGPVKPGKKLKTLAKTQNKRQIFTEVYVVQLQQKHLDKATKSLTKASVNRMLNPVAFSNVYTIKEIGNRLDGDRFKDDSDGPSFSLKPKQLEDLLVTFQKDRSSSVHVLPLSKKAKDVIEFPGIKLDMSRSLSADQKSIELKLTSKTIVNVFKVPSDNTILIRGFGKAQVGKQIIETVLMVTPHLETKEEEEIRMTGVISSPQLQQ